MSKSRFIPVPYSSIDPDDLTTNSCHAAITKLDGSAAGIDVYSISRCIADFLDSIGRFWLEDDDEITQIFSYIPNYLDLPVEKREKLLINGHQPWGGLPEGYYYYSGRIYRFLDHIVIPHSYRQYWPFMYLSLKNYDLLHIHRYLERQLLLAHDKWQFLVDFKNVVRDNYYELHSLGVQDYLYDWTHEQNKTLEAQCMASDGRFVVKASYEELIVFFSSRFKQGKKDVSPILLPDQVKDFVHANFSCAHPAVEISRFHIKKRHQRDVKVILYQFHEEIVCRSIGGTDIACRMLIDNFDIFEPDGFKSLRTNISKYKV